jgi:hypothetical protein
MRKQHIVYIDQSLEKTLCQYCDLIYIILSTTLSCYLYCDPYRKSSVTVFPVTRVFFRTAVTIQIDKLVSY